MLMTGMGEDGAAGMAAVRSAGGITIAQSPETCVVDSMPRAAIERGFARSRGFPFESSRVSCNRNALPEYSTATPSRMPIREILEGDSYETV